MPIAEIKGARELVADLKQVRVKAVPYAMRNALNTVAFEARRIWQGQIRAAFTNRNQYTVRGVLVEQASLGNLQSRVGNTRPYMGDQEEGGSVRKKAIPGPGAAGMAGGGKRTKLVRSRFYLGAIHVTPVQATGGRKQRNAIRMAVARRAGNKTVLLERPNGGKALFALMGGTRSPKTRLLWVVGRSSVKLKSEPTLGRTLAAVKPKADHMLKASLLDQLNRQGIKTQA